MSILIVTVVKRNDTPKQKKTNKTREYKKAKLLSDGMNLALEK